MSKVLLIVQWNPKLCSTNLFFWSEIKGKRHSEFKESDPEYLFQNAIKTHSHYLYVENFLFYLWWNPKQHKYATSFFVKNKNSIFSSLFPRFIEEFRITLSAFVNMAALWFVSPLLLKTALFGVSNKSRVSFAVFLKKELSSDRLLVFQRLPRYPD